MDPRLERLQSSVRPNIKGLAAYAPEDAGPSLRMDANESPADVPESLKREIAEGFFSQPWNRYPDSQAKALCQKLAAAEGVKVNELLVGNGSDEIIRDLQLAFGGVGTRTVFPTPTFAMYRLITLACGGAPVGVRLRPDWSLDMPAMLQAVGDESTRLIFIARPNNPTGNACLKNEVRAILEGTERLVVVDEAYRLFFGESLRSWMADYPHLAILNTFSKSMSLAGLRLGYLLARPEVIEIVNRIRLPYNVDAFAQWAGLKVLEQSDVWQRQAQQVIAERENIAAALAVYPDITVYPSQANFLLIRVLQADTIRRALAQADIAVRGFSRVEGLEDCLRITVSHPEDNRRFLKAMQDAKR